MKKKLISIITVNYNNSIGLQKTLESIDNQIVSEKFEHIIIDGASSDSSVDCIKQYAGKKSNITWVSAPDSGIYDAMNKGLTLSRGDFVCFLNSGDYLENCSVIERLINVVRSNPFVDLIYGDLDFVNQVGVVTRKWVSGHFKKYKIYYGWMFPHPMTVVRKALIEKYTGFDQSFQIAADYDLMLKLALNEQIKCEYVNSSLVKMELGGVSNGNFRQIIKSNIEVLRSWRQQDTSVNPIWIFVTKPFLKILQKQNLF